MERTLIKELSNKIGKTVLLKGWVETYRKLGKKMAFIILRERTGETQIIVRNPEQTLYKQSVIEVVGTVKEEKQSKYNGIEIEAELIVVTSPGQHALPVGLTSKEEIPFNTKLRYNALTLRNKERSAIFKIKAEIINEFRRFMRNNEFTEIHSTKLVNEGLEGGGEMFEVNYFGEKAFLSQSPQFYKQMTVGVYERVFEVGKVYRAEGSNTNRHLSEYVGLDLEMGFINSVEEVMEMEERVIKAIMHKINESCSKELAIFGVKAPHIIHIPRLTYSEAIELIEEKYGKVSKEEGFNNEMEVQISEIVKEKFGEEFVFITKYPLNKRPFYTMPSEEEGCSESFELIYKGMEITTGGQRIHQYEKLLEAIETNGMNSEQYKNYLMAFKYGMPAHGGCGIGTERIVKQLLNLQTVEEASLVPRTKERFV